MTGYYKKWTYVTSYTKENLKGLAQELNLRIFLQPELGKYAILLQNNSDIDKITLPKGCGIDYGYDI